MKKSFLSATAIATVMSASALALAADLPSIKSAPVAPAPIWTGFYAGLNSGWNFGTNSSITNTRLGSSSVGIYNLTAPTAFIPNNSFGFLQGGNSSNNQSGFMGGAQFGYNYQFKNNVVVGIETDIQASNSRGQNAINSSTASSANKNNTGVIHSSNSYLYSSAGVASGLDYLGTVRARLGYLIKPTFLAYGTAGFAYGGAWASVQNNGYAINQSYSNANPYPVAYQASAGAGQKSTLLTGYSVGSGFEWMFMPDWSMKMEALYWNLGNMNVASSAYSPASYAWDSRYSTVASSGASAAFSNTGINYQGITARAGLNYHFNPASFDTKGLSLFASSVPSSKDSEDSSERLKNWQGLHLGLNAGYNWGTNSQTNAQFIQSAQAYVTEYSSGVQNIFANNLVSALTPVTQGQATQTGYLGGLQLGYSRVVSPKILVGFETDIQGSTINGKGNSSLMSSQSFSRSGGATGGGILTSGWSQNNLSVVSYASGVDYLGTARLRIGYLITPSLLVYGTGGLAYGGAWAKSIINGASSATVSFDLGPPATPASYQSYLNQTYFGAANTSALLVGYSAGGGAEWMFAPRWSVRAEALYWNLGNMNLNSSAYAPYANGSCDGGCNYLSGAAATAAFPVSNVGMISGNSRINFQGVAVRTGLNYHMDFGAAEPVIAKF